jgi:dTDP-4-dehydrorhamnose reductase
MILITGASGMLGANVVMEGRKKNKKMVAIFNNNPVKFPGVECLRIDLSDTNAIANLIFSLKPRFIIHCAALTNVDWCEEHPIETKNVNRDIAFYIAEAAQKINSLFIYISTDSVFDGDIGNYTEENSPNPLNVYSSSKRGAELLIERKIKNSLIIRTNIYGWNLQNKLSLAEWIIGTLESGQKLTAFEDVIFSPILVNDLATIIFDMIEAQLNGVYHIGSSDSCSKLKFACELADTFELDRKLIQPISIDSLNLKAKRPKNSSLQTRKICLDLGVSMPTVKSGILNFKKLRDSGFVEEIKSYKEDKL